MPGRPLPPWLYWRLQSPSAQSEREAHAALRLAGRWLKKVQAVPFVGRPSAVHPFLVPPESNFAEVLRAGLIREAELAVIEEAIGAARELAAADHRFVWMHGDFGPGNCLVSRTAHGLRLRVLDFANPF